MTVPSALRCPRRWRCRTPRPRSCPSSRTPPTVPGTRIPRSRPATPPPSACSNRQEMHDPFHAPRPRPGPSRNRPARFPAPTPDRRSSCLIRCQTHRCRHFLDSQEPSFWLTGTRESIKEPDDAGVLIPPTPSPPAMSKLNAQDVQEQVPTPNTFILITYSWVLWHDW